MIERISAALPVTQAAHTALVLFGCFLSDLYLTTLLWRLLFYLSHASGPCYSSPVSDLQPEILVLLSIYKSLISGGSEKIVEENKTQQN